MSGPPEGEKLVEVEIPEVAADGVGARFDTAYFVALLLVLVARGDGRVSQQEIDTMIDLVADHFELKSAEALERVKTAMHEVSSELDLPRYLSNRVRRLSVQEKKEILIMLLQVAKADGIQDAGEIRAVNIAADLIDLPPTQIHEAYQEYFSREAR